MTIHRGRKGRLHEIYHHRLIWYDDAIQRLIDGKADAEYVAMRADKVKEVKRGIRK